MNLKSYIPALAMLAAVSFTACQDDLEDVENRVYDTGALAPSTVLIDGMTDQQAISFKEARPFLSRRKPLLLSLPILLSLRIITLFITPTP